MSLADAIKQGIIDIKSGSYGNPSKNISIYEALRNKKIKFEKKESKMSGETVDVTGCVTVTSVIGKVSL